MLLEILIALAAAATADGDAAGAEPPLGKLSMRTLRVASIDAKSHRIDVKDSGFDIVWQEKKTRFFHHESIPIKDLPAGADLQVHGKRHEERNDDNRKGGKRADPLVTDIEVIGTGNAFTKPASASKTAGLTWEQGKLDPAGPGWLLIEKRRYRLVGDEKLAAYSLTKLAPEKVAEGTRVVITGSARKVTVERDGKPVELTRIEATEVHWVELSAAHAKIFQSEWVDAKKAAPAAAADDKSGASRQ